MKPDERDAEPIGYIRYTPNELNPDSETENKCFQSHLLLGALLLATYLF